MNGRAKKQSSTWDSGAIAAVRRWIAIPLILGLLGGAGGVFAGATSKASAEALLLVLADAQDSYTDLAAENAAVQLNTRSIFTAAAEATEGESTDLQNRSEIAAVPNSQIVSIVVTAATTEQAVTDANAIAAAGVAAGPDRTPAALAQLTKATRDLIKSESLGNTTAERARIDRLGDALGASQAALVANANQIQLLQDGDPTNRLPGAPVLGLLGAFSGALIGLTIALLLGARRGMVKSTRDLAALYPNAAIIDPSDLQQALEMEPNASTVILAGLRGERVTSVTQAVREAISATTGKQVVLFDSLADAPPNAAANGCVNLVTTTLSETVLSRARRDKGSVLIVPVRPRVTKLEAVDQYASRLTDRCYLLVDKRASE